MTVVYIHVDDLLLGTLLEQREESSSHPLYADYVDVENLSELVKLHVLDRTVGQAAPALLTRTSSDWPFSLALTTPTAFCTLAVVSTEAETG